MYNDNVRKIQPMPDRPIYGINDVALFHKHSRKELEQELGRKLEPFNNALRPKYWKDDEAQALDPEDEVTYTVIRVRNMIATVTEVHMSAREAASFNIPDVNEAASRDEWEVPIRKLNPIEVPRYTPFGVVIERLDLKAKAEESRDGFFASDRQLLKDILTAVKECLSCSK